MRRTVVFLVKNGIGFGHIRRALLLAEAVQDAGHLRPIVISQAASLALYRCQRGRVSVVNFPLLHRAPSAVTEDCYLEILDGLLRTLDPAVAVEDTYPDRRYGALPALRDVPRLLVMRRMDSLSFDQLREQGAFAGYDHILIAQDEADFHQEGHSGDSLAAAALSGRFTLAGTIFHAPASAEIAAERARYAPDGRPLVVVSAGAGGDQLADGYTDRLFDASLRVAERLRDSGSPARFVLVTGPYYAGRPLPSTDRITVCRFEPRLAALLGAAHVAIIKPGHNTLSEARHGGAHLILVPGASFMEGLSAYAHRMATACGWAVAPPDPDILEPLVRDALAQPRRPPPRRPSPQRGLRQIVRAIHDHAPTGPPQRFRVAAKQLLLLLALPDPQCRATLDGTRTGPPAGPLAGPLANAIILPGLPEAAGQPTQVLRLTDAAKAHFARVGPRPVTGVLADADPAPDILPDDLVSLGVRLLLVPPPGPTPTLRRWLRRHPQRPSLLVAEIQTLQAADGDSRSFFRRVSLLLDQHATACVLLDLRHVHDPTRYLTEVGDWLAAQPVHLVDVEAICRVHATTLLEQRP